MCIDAPLSTHGEPAGFAGGRTIAEGMGTLSGFPSHRHDLYVGAMMVSLSRSLTKKNGAAGSAGSRIAWARA